MKLFLLALAVAGIVTAPAQASSIEECRGIANDKARLGCYDGLAASSVQSEPPKLNESGFAGRYAGAGASFGNAMTSNASQYSLNGQWQYQDYRLQSPAIDVFAGYNFSGNGLIFGVEGSLRTESQRTEITSLSFSDVDFRTRTTVQEVASPTLSVRLGYETGPFMVYGKAGAGVAILQTRQQSILGGESSVYKDRYTYPAISGGIGAEYSVDAYFGRIEGEVRKIVWDSDFYNSSSDGSLQYRLISAVGVRF